MANEATLGILIQANDQATPKLTGLGNTLSENKMAIRELAMGVSFLGVSFASMGIMLKGTNSELGKGIGNTLLMTGAIMTAIGSTVQFISAIAKVVDALRKLAVMEAIVKAFQGPAGWAMLGIGAAVATGAVAGISAMGRGEKRAAVNITNNIQGSVVTDKQIADTIRRELVKTQQRNNTSGIR